MERQPAPKNFLNRVLIRTFFFQVIIIVPLLVLMLLDIIPSQWSPAGIIMTMMAGMLFFVWTISRIPCPRCTKPARLKLSKGGYYCEFCRVIYTIIDKES